MRRAAARGYGLTGVIRLAVPALRFAGCAGILPRV